MSVQRKMRVSLGTSAWVCFIVKPQPRAGATLCLCYRQVKCCTLWWGLGSGLKWESIGLQGSVFFGLLLFVLWSFLGALKLDIDSLMRNMKLLESFIIFFEVCIAILCNLQQFFLLSGFFFDEREKQLFTFRILEWMFLYCVQLLVWADDTASVESATQDSSWTPWGLSPHRAGLCRDTFLTEQAVGLSAGCSPGGRVA